MNAGCDAIWVEVDPVILFVRAIPRRYFFVVAVVFRSVSQQCKSSYREI
jgi:hypothetical protein